MRVRDSLKHMLAFVALTSTLVWGMAQCSPDKDGPQKMQAKYGCKPTNEFVGKDGDRLWLCADGLKYKESAFYSWAYQDKRDRRGW